LVRVTCTETLVLHSASTHAKTTRKGKDITKRRTTTAMYGSMGYCRYGAGTKVSPDVPMSIHFMGGNPPNRDA
jgi:hypothetical protein